MRQYIISVPEDTRPNTTLPFCGTNSVTGETLGVTNRCFTRNGTPWFPVMGEFHYSRYSHALWEREILKMKAGGIAVIASYVFWLHHEEVEGEFDWTGDRDLDTFLALCEKHKMKVFLRIGPWAHGEARNGGFPDWLMAKDCELRSNHPGYLQYVKRLYGEIAQQATPHLFRDGGCVIGIQLENEYGHCGGFAGAKGREHMLRLKQLALETGFDVPYYTATGWGGAVVVEGAMLPVMGAYADAPWEQHVEELPASPNYIFSHFLNDESIGSDLAQKKPDDLTFHPERYPYAMAELGGGIQVTKHRRPVITARDTQAMIFTRFGSGANLLGYYMYHGGTNPKGRLTTLEESRVTGGYNDLPVLSYDFQGVVGEYGQLHRSYRYLKILHMMAAEFGGQFADAVCYIPPESARDPEDLKTLRFSVLRASGMGLLCLNNHQRHRMLTDKTDIRVTVDGVAFPPFDLLCGECIAYPFAWETDGLCIDYLTAQPLCRMETGSGVTLFVWNYRPHAEMSVNGEAACLEQNVPRVYQRADGKMVSVILLSRRQAENAWKVRTADGWKLIITSAGVVNSQNDVLLYGMKGPEEVMLYPGKAGDTFECRTVFPEKVLPDEDVPFEQTGEHTYCLHLPKQYDEGGEAFLHIDFEGNLANLYHNGERIADWFYTGLPWRVGLKKFAHQLTGNLVLTIESLTEDAWVYMEKKPHYENGVAARLHSVRLEHEGETML